ncbi:MAG: dihydroorotate dehydrogenase electron transfer subunit [Acetivibrio ethanolgignens]
MYSLWISDEEIAREAVPGQFLALYCKDGDRLLPRPISICEIEKEKGQLRLVYRIAGKGTEEFSQLKAGDTLEVMGPLGNGFVLEDKRAILIGGGIGIPPMLELAKTLRKKGSFEVQIVLGYRNADTFLAKEFEAFGAVYLATEDGSLGTKGNVIDAVRANGLSADMIFACGPTPMLRGIKAYAEENSIRAQISLEEKMACGIGACLACVCKSKEIDHHTNVHNKRICRDGPVFYANEIEL